MQCLRMVQRCADILQLDLLDPGEQGGQLYSLSQSCGVPLRLPVYRCVNPSLSQKARVL